MTKRPPGRPRLNGDDRSVPVTVRFPVKEFDAYCSRARREAVSVPEIIRRDLKARECKK